MDVIEFNRIIVNIEEQHPLEWKDCESNLEVWAARWFDLQLAITAKLKGQYQVHDIEEFYKEPIICEECGAELIDGICPTETLILKLRDGLPYAPTI